VVIARCDPEVVEQVISVELLKNVLEVVDALQSRMAEIEEALAAAPDQAA
jgi:hypothetical protein